MRYYSTNKQASLADFKTALLKGLAPDGGLYMPSKLSNFQFPISNFQKFDEIMSGFIDIPKPELARIIKESFNFSVPLVKLDENLYILELFHGPTLSFKDFGARFMARAMHYYVMQIAKRKSQSVKLNIIVATSGDTGSAVASGFYGLPNIKVFVLYPSKRISDLQEKQIATLGKNIVALEVKGDFDDCQRLAKTALADGKLREKTSLSSANSINIGRLLPQMVYYFNGYRQYLSLRPAGGGAKTIDWPVFVIPSGNFGNLTAGLFAKKMGLPAKKFIAAVNINSGVPNYLRNGKLEVRSSKLTMSNAMDVGNPSNWARILDLYGHNRETIKEDLEAVTVSEAETKKTISDIYKKYGYIIDPHTAVGVAAALKSKTADPKIVLATAHPAKFKEIVEDAIGRKIKLPPGLSRVENKKKNSILIKPIYQTLYKVIVDNQL